MSEFLGRVLGFLYLTFARSVKERADAPNLWDPRQKKNSENAIYVFWHSKSFILLPAARKLNIGILTLGDWKNKIYDALCRSFGYQTMSANDAPTAALSLRNLLENGHSVGIALDGPKGPVGKMKPGALSLAVSTGRPLIAVDVCIENSFRLRWRWDQFEVPLPFTKAQAHFSQPIRVNDSNIKEVEKMIYQHLKNI